MKMHRIFAFILIFSSMTIFAADYKVAVVDVDKIMRESAPALRATKKLEKEFESRRVEIQTIAKQGELIESALASNLTQSEFDKKNKERELIALNQNLQRLQREFNEDRNARLNEEISIIQDRIKLAIKKIADIDKYDMIFQQNDLIYFSSRMDITDRVIKQMEAK